MLRIVLSQASRPPLALNFSNSLSEHCEADATEIVENISSVMVKFLVRLIYSLHKKDSAMPNVL